MTGDLSKNRLAKLGYDPRTKIEHRRRFFADKAIRQLSLAGTINALKLLIFEVKSLEKGYSNILKSMEEDLDRLRRIHADTERVSAADERVTAAKRRRASAQARIKRKKRKKLPPHLLDRPQKGSIRLTTGQQ
jgi:hypothetical protein